MAVDAEVFLAKAVESFAGAKSEFANKRFNNCANRCYYACFQAAIYALLQAGIQPRGLNPQWGHAFVQAEFVGQLINRRKVYSSNLRAVLVRTFEVRQAADYKADPVSSTQAARMLKLVQEFLDAIVETKR